MTAHFVALLEDLRRKSLRMASQVEDILQEACESVVEPNESLAVRVIRRDHEIDVLEVEVELEVIRLLALYQPVGVDLRLLCTVLKINNNLERISDCAVNIAERARHGDVQALARRSKELKQLGPIVRQSLRDAVQAYADDDPRLAKKVAEQDAAVDALYGQIIRAVVAEPERCAAQMSAFLDVLSVAKNLERIADHATNIAEDVIFLATGRIVRHQARAPGELPKEGETVD